MKKSICIICGSEINNTQKSGPTKKYCLSCTKQRLLLSKRRTAQKWRKKNEVINKQRKHESYKKWKTTPSYEERKKKEKIKAKEMRKQIIQHYGGKCVCCGETQYEFLAFDHKNGGGNIHRKAIKHAQGGVAWLRWIIKNNYPDILQLLCHNCNMAKGFYGYCPHKI